MLFEQFPDIHNPLSAHCLDNGAHSASDRDLGRELPPLAQAPALTELGDTEPEWS